MCTLPDNNDLISFHKRKTRRVQGIERRLTDKRRLLGGRQRLSDRHEEHSHTEEGADAQGHLLAGLGGHVEHQQRYKVIVREWLTQDIKRLPQGFV